MVVEMVLHFCEVWLLLFGGTVLFVVLHKFAKPAKPIFPENERQFKPVKLNNTRVPSTTLRNLPV